MGNTNLIKAKKVKNDEFYTRYEDIEAELSHYSVEYFRDKVIYCPCDVGIDGLDVPKSNFIKYFENNKERLGYKKLIHTSLQEGYDYRSEYCQKLFKEADVVVTNPPFSLFRDFVKVLEEYNLKYAIIGTVNAITYKEIFPLLRDNKLFLGYKVNGKPIEFIVPDDVELKGNCCGYTSDDKKYIGVGGTCWFTNLDIQKRHENLILVKIYNPQDYPTYDNYNAIEVSKTKDIPYDYEGIMGVPITFLDKYNPDQFEIVGLVNGKDDLVDIKTTKDYSKDWHEYKIGKGLTGSSGKKINGNPVLRGKPTKGCYFTNDNDSSTVYSTYARIFIRRKR